MSSHSSSYGYQLSPPPWTPNVSSAQPFGTLYERAPVMPYVPLPPFDEPHYGLITPPPSPPRIHFVFASRTTVVRYDFARDPYTIRMSSSSPQPSFPGHDLALTPSMTVLSIRCEISGHVITIQRSTGVTCKDVLVQLYRFFDGPISADVWHDVRGVQRDMMKDAYTRRTGRIYDCTAHMKMIDYLLGQSRFKCIVPKHTDASGTSTWLLQTTA